MALDDIVNLTITVASSAPTREGFGVPLVASYHAVGSPARVKTYKKASDMLTAGHTVNQGAYKKAAILCSQENKVKNFLVGRLANAIAQTVTLVCTSATADDVYAIDVTPQGSAKVEIRRTVPGASSTSAEATALAALIDALPGITAAAVGSTVTVTTTAAGDITTFEDWSVNLQFKDTSADPGIAADLAAIKAENNTWYVLLLDSTSEAVINAAAAWCQANGKLFIASTSDWGVQDQATTTDVASDLKGNGYTHTATYYNGRKNPSQLDAGIAGARLPYRPGEDSWNFKAVAGVPAEQTTAAQIASFVAKYCNWFEVISGLNLTQGQGKVASGSYVDITRGIDWLKAEIKVRCLQLLANSKKVPFTDKGIGQVKSAVNGALLAGVRVGLLADTPAPLVTAPKAADVDTINKAARNLPEVEFTATLQGAIDSVGIAGLISL